MARDVIVACDFSGEKELYAFLEKLGSERPYLKIGMELFYSCGAGMVKTLKDRGHKVFLDLKLHDIPNTVKKSMTVLSSLGADMVNVHAAGTIKMMEYAYQGGFQGGKSPLIIAVTQLTSTSEEVMREELLIDRTVDDTVLHYAKNAKKAGLSGVVCSPLESERIHAELGSDFITVTPGVRFPESASSDQVRVSTPYDAGKWGSDYIVVGRPITQAEDPLQAYRRCVEDFMRGGEDR